MTDDAAGAGLSTQDWMREQEGDGPTLIVAERPSGGRDEPADQSVDEDDAHRAPTSVRAQRDNDTGKPPALVDLDASADDAESAGTDINSGAKRSAAWLGAGVLGVAVLIVVAFGVLGGGPDPVTPPQHHATAVRASAAPTTNPPAPQQEQALPYAARTDSCTASGGSTDQLAARSPLALSDTASDSAWVCGRGPQESFVDGQILHVQFVCDPARPGSACSYMLHSLSVTPGWVAKTPGGKDEWLQHRVVTRLQFNFFNGNELAGDPVFVDTHSVHGPVSAALPTRVLASRVDVLILHTDRPPAAPLPTTSGATPRPDTTGLVPPPGLLDSVLGTGAPYPAAPATADPAAAGADPVDATFAMSQLQFFGHSPT